jgi:hypothetical protein
MNYALHTIQNQIMQFTESVNIDCDKENINTISFKVKGTGEVLINSMPIEESDGIVSFFNNMPVRDMTRYDLVIPSGVVVYVIKTHIVNATVKETIIKNC